MSASVSDDRVTIVGGGIIGIACAHYLSQAGACVTVIDRGTIAGACSHSNCGYICPSHVLPLTEPGAISLALKSIPNRNAPFRIKPRLSPTLWKWLWQFARRCHRRQMLDAGKHLKTILDSSMTEYKTLLEDETLECQWRRQGLLYVFRTDKGMEEFAETDALLTRHFNVAARCIDGSELSDFDPGFRKGLAGGYFYEDDACVRPDQLAANWSHRLREAGVDFVQHCQLYGLEKTNGRVTRLLTSKGRFETDQVVVATGAWTPELASDLECRIPIQPGKGYSVTLERPPNSPRHSALLPEHRIGVTPFEEALRLGSMMEFAGYDTSIPPRRIQQLRDSARLYLAGSCDEPEQSRWYGWRPMTWDSLPIIGRTPRLQNVCLATGHNMLGLSLATATGKLVAEIIQNIQPHIDPAPYLPNRF